MVKNPYLVLFLVLIGVNSRRQGIFAFVVIVDLFPDPRVATFSVPGKKWLIIWYLQEREEKKAAEEKRRLEKEAKKREAEAKAAALEAAKRVPPSEMFKVSKTKFTAWRYIFKCLSG